MMGDLFADEPTGRRGIVATYPYYNADGLLVYEVVRYANPKTFRQRRPHPARPGEWLWKMRDVPRLLYRLPKLLSSPLETLVYLVEGEKDVETLEALGCLATTNPMGSDNGTGNKWLPAFTACLTDRHVVLLPDHDTSGQIHVAYVARQLQGVAASVRILALPGLGDKEDVSDWVAHGGTRADLEALLISDGVSQPLARLSLMASGLLPGAPALSPAIRQAQNPLSDTRNAATLVADHRADILYVADWKRWLVWCGTHWDRDTTGAMMRKAQMTVKAFALRIPELSDELVPPLLKHIKNSLSARSLAAMLTLAQSVDGVSVLPSHLNTDPWLLNVANGTLNLQTGTLRPHARADFMTYCLPTPYEPDAPCPRWERFLTTVLAGSPGLTAFLQRMVGYSLTGVVRDHVLPILHGAGRNGKSTFLNTLLALLGPYGIKAAPTLLLSSQGERHPTEKADLFGKRVVVAIETEADRYFSEVTVKELTGGDTIRARRMHEDFFEFPPTHKLWLATNHPPRVRGTDHAIWSRLKLVPFHVTIDEPDTALPEALLTELPGILAWAVRGCLAWQAMGLEEPGEVRDETSAYREAQDILQAFLEEYCLCTPGTEPDAATSQHVRLKGSELYQRYSGWCRDQGEGPLSANAFGRALTNKGYQSRRSGGTCYYGLAWKPPETPKDDLPSPPTSECDTRRMPETAVITFSCEKDEVQMRRDEKAEPPSVHNVTDVHNNPLKPESSPMCAHLGNLRKNASIVYTSDIVYNTRLCGASSCGGTMLATETGWLCSQCNATIPHEADGA
jgi:putative DNA primase/helicase